MTSTIASSFEALKKYDKINVIDKKFKKIN